MAASRDDVDGWIKEAIKNKQEFIISVCDTWDYDDYPVYCKDKEELLDKYSQHDDVNMQRVNEIIHIEGKKVTENLGIHQFR